MRERMHFSFELAVAKYLAAPVSESAVRYRPPRLRSTQGGYGAITCMSRLCTAQKRSAYPLEGDAKAARTI
jgi:hypothetical protein